MNKPFVHLIKYAIWLAALPSMVAEQAIAAPHLTANNQQLDDRSGRNQTITIANTRPAGAKSLATAKRPYVHAGQRWVLQPQTLTDVAFIIQIERHKRRASINDRIYVQGQLSKSPSHYNIVQRSGTYLDPTTNELLGLEVKSIGVADLVAVHQDVSIMQIISADQSIRIGDRLIPQSWSLAKNVQMPKLKPLKVTIQGQIIAVLDNANAKAQQKIIAINQGLREGIEKGNLLSFYNDAAVTKNTQSLTGSVVVLQVFDKMSYGVVLKLNKEPAIGDLLRGSE